MKTANRTFSRLLSCALVFLLALTTVVPVFADSVAQNNLEVVIHNNEGLPCMSTDQFTVYQLFTGTPHYEGPAEDAQYGADNWNNYTLADVQWGSSIQGTLQVGDDGYNSENPDSNKYDHSAKLLETLQALDPDADAWAYDEEGANVFAGVTTAADLAKVLENHNTNDFMQHFATIIAGIEELVKVKVTPTLTEGKTDEQDDNSKDYLTYTFTEPGYYMFADTHELSDTDADARSEYIIAVLGDQEINLKASVPTVDKEIVESGNTSKGDVAGVSDYVQFKLTGTLPQNFEDFDFYKYIFHDTLSKGLTYVNDATHPLTVKVYASQDDADNDRDGVVIPATYGEGPSGTNYTVKDPISDPKPEDCSLEVSFDDLKALQDTDHKAIEVTADSYIVVTYYAQVNEDAVILDDGNPNTVDLEYSNDPNHDGTGKTKEKTVYVYAFGLDLTKVGSDTAHSTGLEGAGFVLKKGEGESVQYAIFEDQWIVTTETDGVKTQTFYDTQEEAEAAAADGGTMQGPVRRLTGWTDAETSADVKAAIADYHTAKANFDKATKEDQASPSGAAYVELQSKKNALERYLLESKGEKGEIPDVYGLDEGSYFLEEVIVPDGYNTPEEDFDIKIEAEINESTDKLESVTYTHGTESVTYKAAYTKGDPEYDDSEDMVARFHSGLLKDTIENQKAPFPPFTGGIGTLIFYILGIALNGGAVTYLVIASKKRKKAEEKA